MKNSCIALLAYETMSDQGQRPRSVCEVAPQGQAWGGLWVAWQELSSSVFNQTHPLIFGLQSEFLLKFCWNKNLKGGLTLLLKIDSDDGGYEVSISTVLFTVPESFIESLPHHPTLVVRDVSPVRASRHHTCLVHHHITST